MRRAWLLPIAVGGIAGALTVASAASLTVTSKDLTVLSVTATPPPAGDTTAPALIAVEPLKMYDNDANGKVDRVTVSFNETLAPYAAGTTPWMLTNIPSGGTLSSVTVSGSTATLNIAEGSGASNTAVGTFTVALAANANGIRDAAGNQSSFAATAPADKAGPVATNLATTNAGEQSGQRRPGTGDTLSITFSETLKASSICSTWTSDVAPQSATGVTVEFENNAAASGSDQMTFSGCGVAGALNMGTLDLGSTGYVTSDQTFTNSSVAWNPSTRVVTITLGSGSANAENANLDRIFTPSASLTDLAGNGGAGKHTQKLQMF